MTPRFTITCEVNKSYKPVADLTLPILTEYCDRHGYKLSVRIIEEPVRSIVWDRVLHMQSELQNCDWVVHVDADILLTNLYIPLTEFIESEKSIVISKAVTELSEYVFNDGFLMVNSNHPETAEILASVWKMDWPEEKIFCAQDALWRIYNWGCEDFHVIPQGFCNAFDYREYGMSESTQGQWHPGCFNLHLPGISNERRVEILQQHIPLILR